MKTLKNRHLINTILNRLSIIFFLFTALNSNSQIQIGAPVQNQTDAENLVKNVLISSEVEVKNIKYVAFYDSLTGAGQISSFTNGSTTNIGLDKGIILSTGDTRGAKGTNNRKDSTTFFDGLGDADLNPLAGANTVDAAVIEFDFKPASSPVLLKYVFASEEYPEWVCSLFNDIFAFFITGTNPDGGNYTNTNLAIVPGTSLPVSINSVNPGVVGINPRTGIPNPPKNCKSLDYSNLYVDNTAGTTIQYDGFTKAFTAQAKVIPCQWYHIKFAIADVYDGRYDSSVFLEASSFSSPTVDTKVSYSISNLGDFAVRGCSKTILRFEIPAAIEADKYVNFTLSGTAVKGTDYTTTAFNNSFVTIPAGQTSVELIIDPIDYGNPQGDKTVIVNVESKICTYDSYTIILKDNPKLTAKASDNKRICKGDTAKLMSSATGGWLPYTYKWSNNAGNTQDVIVKPIFTSSYTVSVYDLCGKPATTSVVIDVNTFSTTIPKNQIKDTLCFGENTFLKTINKDGDSPYKYLWTKDNAPLDPLAEFTDINNNISSSPQIEKYLVTVTDNFGCKSKDSITIFKYPELKVFPCAPKQICKGDSTEISVTNTGTPPYTFKWSGNAGNTDKVTVTPETNTTYTVSVTDICKSTVTATVIVTVKPLPTAMVTPSTLKLLQDSSGTLYASTGADYFYQWMKNGNNISGATNSSLKVSEIGEYTVSITSNGCSKISNKAVVTINACNLAVKVTVNKTALCYGESAVIAANPQGGTAAYIYLWHLNNNPIDSTHNSFLIINNSNNANFSISEKYIVKVTDASNCISTDSLTIIKYAALKVNASGDKTICKGDTTILYSEYTGGSAPYIFNWSNEAGNNQNITVVPITTTTYTITVNDACKKAVTDDVIINVIRKPIKSGILKKGERILVCDDHSVDFYQWYQNDTKLLNQNKQFYAVPLPLNLTDSFYVVTKYNLGCDSKSEVYRFPAPTIRLFSDNDFIIINPTLTDGLINFFINSKLAISNYQLSINIYNSLGQKMNYELYIKNNQNQIDLSKLNNGIYFIDFVLDNEKFTKKIILNK